MTHYLCFYKQPAGTLIFLETLYEKPLTVYTQVLAAPVYKLHLTWMSKIYHPGSNPKVQK